METIVQDVLQASNLENFFDQERSQPGYDQNKVDSVIEVCSAAVATETGGP